MPFKVTEIEFHFARLSTERARVRSHLHQLIKSVISIGRGKNCDAFHCFSGRQFQAGTHSVCVYSVIFMENPTLCNLIHAWDTARALLIQIPVFGTFRNGCTLIFDPSRVTNAPLSRSHSHLMLLLYYSTCIGSNVILSLSRSSLCCLGFGCYLLIIRYHVAMVTYGPDEIHSAIQW